jgi:hypothetical protein
MSDNLRHTEVVWAHIKHASQKEVVIEENKEALLSNLTHVCDRIFTFILVALFLLVVLCLLGSISDLI